MQLGEPAQDIGRNVLIATVAGGAVVRLTDPDVGGSVQQALDPDSGFGAGQRCAWAAVDSPAECQVLAGVLALRVERVRILEPTWVAVGCAVHHHQCGPGGDVGFTDGRRDT